MKRGARWEEREGGTTHRPFLGTEKMSMILGEVRHGHVRQRGWSRAETLGRCSLAGTLGGFEQEGPWVSRGGSESAC
jgi:hypothetical protein